MAVRRPAAHPTFIAALQAAVDEHPEALYYGIGKENKDGPVKWRGLSRKRIDGDQPDQGEKGMLLIFPKPIGPPIANGQGPAVYRWAPAPAPEAPAVQAAPPAPPAEEAAPPPDEEDELSQEEEAAHLQALRPPGEAVQFKSADEHLRYLTARAGLLQQRSTPQLVTALTRHLEAQERALDNAHKREAELRQELRDTYREMAEDARGGSLMGALGAIASALAPAVQAGIAGRAPRRALAAPTVDAAPAGGEAAAEEPPPNPLAAILNAADPAKLQTLLADPDAAALLRRHGIEL